MAKLKVTYEGRGRVGYSEHLTRTEDGTLPVSFAMKLRGKNREEKILKWREENGEPFFGRYPKAKWEAFVADVKRRGIQDPILVIKDYGKEPVIYEGNHRVRAAEQAGLRDIPVEIRYFGHGEQDGLVSENTVRASSSELQKPALREIMQALQRQPKDLRALRKSTGLTQNALRAYLTRLLFLGAVTSRGGRYVLTERGHTALSASALSAAQAVLAGADVEAALLGSKRARVPGVGMVEFLLQSSGHQGGPAIEAWKGDEEIGSLSTRLTEYGEFKVIAITDVEVDPQYQGKGLASKMYKMAEGLAKRYGRKLASDTWLDSPATRHLWDKLERAGRAVKVALSGGDVGYVLTAKLYTDPTGRFFGTAGAGGLFYAEDTGRVLVQKRSRKVNEPNTWGVWGGKIDSGEDPEQAVRREVVEESRYRGQAGLVPVYTYKEGDFRYSNFLIVVPHEFEPRHGWESSGHKWTSIDEMPKPLHFGLKAALPHYKRAVAQQQSARVAASLRAAADVLEARIQHPPRDVFAPLKLTRRDVGALLKQLDKVEALRWEDPDGREELFDVVGLDEYARERIRNLLEGDDRSIVRALDNMESALKIKNVTGGQQAEWLLSTLEYDLLSESGGVLTHLQRKVDDFNFREAKDFFEPGYYEHPPNAERTVVGFMEDLAATVKKLTKRFENLRDGLKEVVEAGRRGWGGAKDVPPPSENVETLYHASLNAKNLKREGFEKEVPAGGGIGGAQGDKKGKPAVSFTSDLQTAKEIARSLKEATMVMQGRYKLPKILDDIRREDPKLLDRIVENMRRTDGAPFPPESDEDLWSLYNSWIWLSNKKFNPVYFGGGRSAWVKMFKRAKLSDIGVVAAEVDMSDPDINYLRAMHEYRVPPRAIGEVTKLIR